MSSTITLVKCHGGIQCPSHHLIWGIDAVGKLDVIDVFDESIALNFHQCNHVGLESLGFESGTPRPTQHVVKKPVVLCQVCQDFQKGFSAATELVPASEKKEKKN